MQRTESPPLAAQGQLGWPTIAAFAALAVIALGIGGVGGWATFQNLVDSTDSRSNAASVVMFGEGGVFLASAVAIGRARLGLPVPLLARAILWVIPAVAVVAGIALADDGKVAVAQALSPLGMTISAEVLSYLTRSILIYQTGVDTEAQRHNAEVMQKLSFQRACAANHPDEDARKKAELKAWKLAAKVGTGDPELGSGLVTVQRERMTEAADDVLKTMFTLPDVTRAVIGKETATPAVTQGVTAGEILPPPNAQNTQANTGDRDPKNGEKDVTQGVPRGVSLTQVAAVEGVETPQPSVPLSDKQLEVVLRWMRHADNPPLSYRQAADQFRSGGYIGSEERVRRTWAELVSREEADA